MTSLHYAKLIYGYALGHGHNLRAFETGHPGSLRVETLRERLSAAAKDVPTGVRFMTYGEGRDPSHALGTCELVVSDELALPVDPAELAQWPREHEWGDRLARTLEILNITPMQHEPSWLLVAEEEFLRS